MHTKVYSEVTTNKQTPMANFENIPYVFELARIHRKCENITLTYDEYSEYSKIYEDMPESGKLIVFQKVKERIVQNKC